MLIDDKTRRLSVKILDLHVMYIYEDIVNDKYNTFKYEGGNYLSTKDMIKVIHMKIYKRDRPISDTAINKRLGKLEGKGLITLSGATRIKTKWKRSSIVITGKGLSYTGYGCNKLVFELTQRGKDLYFDNRDWLFNIYPELSVDSFYKLTEEDKSKLAITAYDIV